MNAMKWSLDFILLAIEDALQGVEVLGDVAENSDDVLFKCFWKRHLFFLNNILAVLAAN